ncbi:MAG: hypothetical protein ABWK02_03500 [Aquificaceae bacterium]
MKKFFLAVLLLTAFSFSREVPFDNLQTFMLWGFGILFSGMGILIGLVM